MEWSLHSNKQSRGFSQKIPSEGKQLTFFLNAFYLYKLKRDSKHARQMSFEIFAFIIVNSCKNIQTFLWVADGQHKCHLRSFHHELGIFCRWKNFPKLSSKWGYKFFFKVFSLLMLLLSSRLTKFDWFLRWEEIFDFLKKLR